MVLISDQARAEYRRQTLNGARPMGQALPTRSLSESIIWRDVLMREAAIARSHQVSMEQLCQWQEDEAAQRSRRR